MPSPEQIAAMQRQLAIDAEKMGVSVPEFIGESARSNGRPTAVLTPAIAEHLKRQAAERMQAQQQQAQQGQHQHQHSHPHQHQHQHQQGQPQPIVPGPPNPVAISLATFLRSQKLKPRTCILNGERKDMFRVSPSSTTPYPANKL